MLHQLREVGFTLLQELPTPHQKHTGALTREMSKDFGPLGVRVNAIAPGEVKTAILSEGTDKIVADVPMKRLGLPEEVADTIFYLCSKEASYVSGQK